VSDSKDMGSDCIGLDKRQALYFLFFFSNLSSSSCCSFVAFIVSSSVTLGIFRSTGNESTNLILFYMQHQVVEQKESIT
jgi:hypothetical protein